MGIDRNGEEEGQKECARAKEVQTQLFYWETFLVRRRSGTTVQYKGQSDLRKSSSATRYRYQPFFSGFLKLQARQFHNGKVFEIDFEKCPISYYLKTFRAKASIIMWLIETSKRARNHKRLYLKTWFIENRAIKHLGSFFWKRMY